MTEASGNPEFRALVLSRALSQIEKQFKPAARAKITSDMVESAVNESLAAVLPSDLALALQDPRFCLRCGSCCKLVDTVEVGDDDIGRIGFTLGIDPALVEVNFTKKTERGLSLRTQPCPFLKGNLCSIYQARPKSCRTFPFAPVNIEQGREVVSLAYYPYCHFTVNLMAQKTISILLRQLIEREEPNLAAAMKRHVETVAEKTGPLSQVQQIAFHMQYRNKMRKQLEQKDKQNGSNSKGSISKNG